MISHVIVHRPDMAYLARSPAYPAPCPANPQKPAMLNLISVNLAKLAMFHAREGGAVCVKLALSLMSAHLMSCPAVLVVNGGWANAY